MKKIFNYIMAIVFIMSICALDSEIWIVPIISALVSGIYLFSAYKEYEEKQFKQGGESVESQNI